MLSKIRLRHIYLFPFLVIAIYLAIENVSIELKKLESFSSIAQDSSALSEVDYRQMERGTVAKVVDGDTIKLETGETIRYIGIDTPETKHPNKPVQCFGKEASNKNTELVEGKEVLLEKDVSDTDRYGRLLRYVYLPNPDATNEAIFVNEYMVEQGYAHVYTYPPDVKYDKLLRDAETIARVENKGLWENCQFQ